MDLRDAYQIMLGELRANHLEVILIPSNYKDLADTGAKIRVVVSENVDWYKELCRLHPKGTSPRLRKNPRTKITRDNIDRVLSRLAAGEESESKYAPFLEDKAQWMIRIIKPTQGQIDFLKLYGELPTMDVDDFIHKYGYEPTLWECEFYEEYSQYPKPWMNQF